MPNQQCDVLGLVIRISSLRADVSVFISKFDELDKVGLWALDSCAKDVILLGRWIAAFNFRPVGTEVGLKGENASASAERLTRNTNLEKMLRHWSKRRPVNCRCAAAILDSEKSPSPDTSVLLFLSLLGGIQYVWVWHHVLADRFFARLLSILAWMGNAAAYYGTVMV